VDMGLMVNLGPHSDTICAALDLALAVAQAESEGRTVQVTTIPNNPEDAKRWPGFPYIKLREYMEKK
jgi:hypothetical protein